jgi:hypothetical protein
MKELNLMIHAGGHRVDRVRITDVTAPARTETYQPIPHHTFLDGVQSTLERAGLRVIAEAHALAKNGARYFGLLQLQSAIEAMDYSLVLGLRNSHDKSFPAGLVVGSGVFVCDNLAFSGEIRIARKHTVNINRDLPNLIGRAVGRLNDMRGLQDRRIAAYKATEITDTQAHDLLIQALDARIVTATRIPAVLGEWRAPRHAEFAQDRNVWRLMQAFTEVAKGTSVFDRPRATQAMHALLDMASGVGQN